MATYISSHPNVQGGEPCIKGTRTPVATILHLFKHGYSAKQIHALYPWISINLLQGAISEVIDQGMDRITTQLHG
jgi:uncharacterized protein (DUF433 family)